MPGRKQKFDSWLNGKVEWFNLMQKFPAFADKNVYNSLEEEDLVAIQSFVKIQEIKDKEKQRELDLRSKMQR
jgi:hypothetical protein